MGGESTAAGSFRASDTSGVVLTIYPRNDDWGVGQDGHNRSIVRFQGRKESDEGFSVVSLSTVKTLGPAYGTWTATTQKRYFLKQHV